MQLLAWLESSGFSQWVLATSWVYPWVIGFHSIGMAFLVGIIAMLALRALGFGSFAVAPLERFLIVIHIALAINVASGVTLFVIQAQEFFYSPTFRVKMLLIVAGIVAGALLNDRLFGAGADPAVAAAQQRSTKAIAGITLVCWAGAIAAGRMTAYLP